MLASYSPYFVQVQGRVGWGAPRELACETILSLTLSKTVV